MGSKCWVGERFDEEAPKEINKTIKSFKSQSACSSAKRVKFLDEIKDSIDKYAGEESSRKSSNPEVYSYFSAFDSSENFLAVMANSVVVYDYLDK